MRKEVPLRVKDPKTVQGYLIVHSVFVQIVKGGSCEKRKETAVNVWLHSQIRNWQRINIPESVGA